MRIAELHWAFPPTIGGVETHLSILGPALVQRGHQVSLLVGQPPGIPAQSAVNGVTVYRTPWLDLNRMSPDLFQQHADKIVEVVHRFLDQWRPDVIHVHNWHYFSPVPLEAVVSWKERHGAALVLTAHNTWHDGLFQQLAQYADEYDAVIAVSQYTADDMVEWGYPRAKIHVVHHGVTDQWLHQPRRPAYVFDAMRERRVIFHPARMSLAKGSMVVLEAFHRLHQRYPDTFLLMAGTSQTVDWDSVQNQEIAAIEEKIARYQLTEAVGIRTFEWPEILGAYDAASVVVYPSVFAEPFGIVVIEAMARGRPTVITRSGGMPEIVQHGHSGWVVEPNQVEALTEALVWLLDHPDHAEQLGARARERVMRKFSASRMVADTERILKLAVGVKAAHDQPVAP